MRACYGCGRLIRGKLVLHVPTVLSVRLGTDFEKAYHPGCHARAEAAAARELLGAAGAPKEGKATS